MPTGTLNYGTKEPTGAEEFIEYFIKYYSRTLRSVAYMLVAALLIRENQYGVDFSWGMIAAFGLFGFSTASARIAQFGLFSLFLMALFPPDALRAISAAITG